MIEQFDAQELERMIDEGIDQIAENIKVDTLSTNEQKAIQQMRAEASILGEQLGLGNMQASNQSSKIIERGVRQQLMCTKCTDMHIIQQLALLCSARDVCLRAVLACCNCGLIAAAKTRRVQAP